MPIKRKSTGRKFRVPLRLRQETKLVRNDLTGRTYGAWIVLGYGSRAPSGHTRWLCRCSCGHEREVLAGNLVRGKTVSCGHEQRTAGGLWKENQSEYDTWAQMLKRCELPTNASYDHYGGRGIRVCRRWQEFGNFLKDMGKRPFPDWQLDRINNDGDYEPESCRWVSPSQNVRNSTSATLLEFDGRSMSIAEWAEEKGVNPRVFYARRAKGWSVERMLTQPVRRSPRKK